MKYKQKIISIIFLGIVLITGTVSVFAEITDEAMQAADQIVAAADANKLQTMPHPGQAEAVKEPEVVSSPMAASKPASPVMTQAVAPSQPMSPIVTQAMAPSQPAVPGAFVPPASSASDSATTPQPAVKPFPSGLLEIKDYKYPVFLYVPANYRPDNSYPMVLIAPSEGAEAMEGIKYLKVLADRRSLFILSPHGLWTDDSDVPYMLDQWIMKIKTDVMQRFPIDKKRVYLAGKDTGANYAAYLAMQYPDQFSGAALIGSAWESSFSPIMKARSNPDGQVPFFVALRADQPEIKAKNQIWFEDLQAKGYPIRLVEVKSAEEFSTVEFKNAMFDWLEKTGQDWSATVAQSQKSFKAKLKKSVKNFFTV